MKVILLEDDLILNEIIEEFLEELGYEVDSFYDGESAVESIFSELYDLLILDVNVPNLDGFELLRSIRAESINTPAIFITSLNSLDDMQKGFDSGCDDYIKKPFELKELELRINNIIKRFGLKDDFIKIDENISLDLANLELKNSEILHKLSNKESKILNYFFNNKNRIVSQDELLSNVWSYEDHPSYATLRTYIKNLRKILGDEYIENIKGVGYRFNTK